MPPTAQADRIQFAMRSYQLKSYKARMAGCTRFVERIHRRGGKDRHWLNMEFLESQKRVGNYVHVFPTQNQGRHDVWDNTFHSHVDGVERPVKLYDKTGQFLSIFPREFVRNHSEQEMQLNLINGSVFQIMGADDENAIARLRGQNGVAYVFSESAFMHPGVWKTIEPVLLENGGWAAFISTPNVEGDEFDQLCTYASTAEGWFFQSLNVEETRRDAAGENGQPIISLNEINAIRARGVREEEIQREYYCNTKGYRRGTIYGDLMNKAFLEKRIDRFLHIPQLPVGICLDLGYSGGDRMACWLYQRPSVSVVNFINYFEDSQKDLKWVAHELRERFAYSYGRMCLPHDGKQAAEFFEAVHFHNVDVADRPQSIPSAIDAVRQHFGQFCFDSINCARGIECLNKYKYEWDDEKRVFATRPFHDEFSHGADALRAGVSCGFDPLVFSGAVGYGDIKVESEFDPRSV